MTGDDKPSETFPLQEADDERARKRLMEALEAVPDGFAIYDADDRLVFCNARYRDVYATSARVMVPGTRFEDILRHGLKEGQYIDAVGREDEWLKERLAAHRNPGAPLEQALPGDRFVSVVEVRTPGGDIVGFRSDITELKRAQREAEAKARALKAAIKEAEAALRTDSLTGIGNRRALDLLLKSAARAARPGDRVAFLQIDLDRFKQINDMFGHAAGDHVLRHVAGILRGVVRRRDFVARVGGDEFAVLLSGRPDRQQAGRIAARIIEGCRAPVDFEGKPCHFGASIGIAIADAASAGSVMANADIALYAAKTAGRNRYAFFNDALRREAEKRKRMADDLLNALDTGQITALYQPQVRAEDGGFAGVEALARWRHPDLGLLAPDAFLDIAEDLGVTADLDAQVLTLALGMADRLAAKGRDIPKLSVNVSYRRLRDSALVNRLESMRPWATALSFELLETIDFDGEIEAIRWTLDRLRDLDIGIEIDDFGSGHASITSLLRLKPDRLKIDRHLVSAMGRGVPGARELIGAIGEMAGGLGIGLIGEGVETAEQARFLRGAGCAVLQGYLVAQPLGEAELEDWLAARSSAGRALSA